MKCLSSRELTGNQFRSVLNITAEERDGGRKAIPPALRETNLRRKVGIMSVLNLQVH